MRNQEVEFSVGLLPPAAPLKTSLWRSEGGRSVKAWGKACPQSLRKGVCAVAALLPLASGARWAGLTALPGLRRAPSLRAA